MIAYGPELRVAVTSAKRRRSELESGLREMVRSGRLPAGSRMPSSRALATDIRVSRRLVTDAYAQLVAEGYLRARRGDGTYVALNAGRSTASRPERARRLARVDLFPGVPDTASFPRAMWLRATSDVVRSSPPDVFAYPDPRGHPELRFVLASYLARVRGVVCEADSIVICSGATQAVALLARALAHDGGCSICVEDPGLPLHRRVLEYAGLEVEGAEVDDRGLRVDRIRAGAVLTTPAHQWPTGVALAPERRSALLQWAESSGGVIFEDDYDAEYRYDRDPSPALQGQMPDRTVYLGSLSKTLSPGLRLGWLVPPPRCCPPSCERRCLMIAAPPRSISSHSLG